MQQVPAKLSIALVGMPGVGKSTIGRHLARRLSLAFHDSDGVIEKQVNQPIRSFFETQGEAAFRRREADTIAQLLDHPPLVLATGGGAVLRPETRDRLRAACKIIYLRSTPEELHRRLRHDTHRPLLQVKDPQVQLIKLHAQRDPIYRSVADFIIETGRPSVASVVNMILMQLELAGFATTSP